MQSKTTNGPLRAAHFVERLGQDLLPRARLAFDHERALATWRAARRTGRCASSPGSRRASSRSGSSSTAPAARPLRRPRGASRSTRTARSRRRGRTLRRCGPRRRTCRWSSAGPSGGNACRPPRTPRAASRPWGPSTGDRRISLVPSRMREGLFGSSSNSRFASGPSMTSTRLRRAVLRSSSGRATVERLCACVGGSSPAPPGSRDDRVMRPKIAQGRCVAGPVERSREGWTDRSG